MKIEINNKPEHSIRYRYISDFGEQNFQELPIYFGRVSDIPTNIESLIITSDLQGRELNKAGNKLLGEIIPEELNNLLHTHDREMSQSISILAGDFYSRELLDRRGGYGNVIPVWFEFRKYSKNVVGIAGNHDLFTQDKFLLKAFQKEQKITLLDKNMIEIDGLKIGGISGILGNPLKPFRKTMSDYLGAVIDLIKSDVEILVLHEGPDLPEFKELGLPNVREQVVISSVKLVIRGHKKWEKFFYQYENGTYIINAHEKVIILFNDKM